MGLIAQVVSNQTMPPGCIAKVVQYTAQLANAPTDTLDLRQFILQGNINAIQGVYIDNSGNADPVTVNSGNGTPPNQNVTIKGHTQGWIPIAVIPGNEVFGFASAGAVNVPFLFSNIPMPLGTWPTQ